MNTIGDLLEAKGVIVMTTERRANAARLRSPVFIATLKDENTYEPLLSLAMKRTTKFNYNITIKATDKASAALKQATERNQR